MLRRDFLTRAAALAAPAVLCCRRAAEIEASPSRPLGPLEHELAIYNWSDYIAPDTVRRFEQEFGVRVTYDTYESNEEMLAKLQSGATGYDLVVPSSYLLPALQANHLLAPLHTGYLTNRANIAPLFRSPPFDPGDRFTVPWQWGTTGIAWRRDLVPAPPAGWEVFQDSRYRGRMTMMDDGREVVGAFLKYRGRSLNDTDGAALAAAKADAVAAKGNLRAYKSAPVKGDLIAGDVWIAQLWNGDAAQAAAERPEIGFVVPRQGSAIWTDSFVLLKSAPHKRAAHEFLNFVLRPDVAARVADATGYGSPNQAALARQRRPVAYPTSAERERLEYFTDLGTATEAWDRLWTEIKSA